MSHTPHSHMSTHPTLTHTPHSHIHPMHTPTHHTLPTLAHTPHHTYPRTHAYTNTCTTHSCTHLILSVHPHTTQCASTPWSMTSLSYSTIQTSSTYQVTVVAGGRYKVPSHLPHDEIHTLSCLSLLCVLSKKLW